MFKQRRSCELFSYKVHIFQGKKDYQIIEQFITLDMWITIGLIISISWINLIEMILLYRNILKSIVL